ATADYFPSYWGRLRDIASNEKGELFLASNSGSHRIIKLYNASYTGLPAPIIDYSIKIYPNPNSSILKVELGNAFEAADIKLYSTERKLLRQNRAKSKSIVLARGNLSPGVYLLEIHSGEKHRVEKVVFQ